MTVFTDPDGNRRANGRRTLVDRLPNGRHQQDNVVAGPDGRLYLGSGSTCNACPQRDRRSAAILSLLPSGKDLQVVASGLRNPYGLAFDAHGQLVGDRQRPRRADAERARRAEPHRARPPLRLPLLLRRPSRDGLRGHGSSGGGVRAALVGGRPRLRARLRARHGRRRVRRDRARTSATSTAATWRGCTSAAAAPPSAASQPASTTRSRSRSPRPTRCSSPTGARASSGGWSSREGRAEQRQRGRRQQEVGAHDVEALDGQRPVEAPPPARDLPAQPPGRAQPGAAA